MCTVTGGRTPIVAPQQVVETKSEAEGSAGLVLALLLCCKSETSARSVLFYSVKEMHRWPWLVRCGLLRGMCQRIVPVTHSIVPVQADTRLHIHLPIPVCLKQFIYIYTHTLLDAVHYTS